MSERIDSEEVQLGSWDQFWFAPAPVARIATIRSFLCVLTLAYFLSAWADVTFWFADGGPFSNPRVSTFLQSAGLDDAATWIVSPLFLANQAWMYHGYLILGGVLSVAVAFGLGGRWLPWILWLVFVGWANRAMILSGLSETALSLGLFASAIAPPGGILQPRSSPESGTISWLARFSERLLATQVTVILTATLATMLAGRVWSNGLGAYALAAPSADRVIDWTNSLLTRPSVHEALTHLMVIAIPVGIGLAWIPRTSAIGKATLVTWCLLVAALGSLWIYGLTLAVMCLSIHPGAAKGKGA